mmetsp:Transcript_355/g.566  ORF Transcript_355/g.566 Transcript_355/m.566 type:complete len:100 (+) Transcript_355:1542-1841(+)
MCGMSGKGKSWVVSDFGHSTEIVPNSRDNSRMTLRLVHFLFLIFLLVLVLEPSKYIEKKEKCTQRTQQAFLVSSNQLKRFNKVCNKYSTSDFPGMTTLS